MNSNFTNEEKPLFLPSAVLQKMVQHLRREWPFEGCGLLWLHKDGSWDYQPMENMAGDPRRQYRLAGEEWVRCLLQGEKKGSRLIAIVHSHPFTPPIPSREDLQGWNEAASYMVIVSFRQRTRPQMAVYSTDQLKHET